ncbi:LysR family transcriptional regulator [Denitrobaculum tricleocarpae]|uniref:LysR family transcriptional regulator n=1 Tax=Denitrobaculum tricleocarpae TaxID=2591009 RepID=A0A545U2P4_9PROT|nr:LysR family transcriptional regulator [Denitrobaculum tricleocarpae]TQV83752.1 LysR family transcriptional regulator [Denitrobaculum tricleocarpae]
MLEWDGLRDFAVVAEAGSLSAGAKRLQVSQPTISRRIGALEAHLKARLFNRVPRGLELTEAGEDLLERVRRMELEALSIERFTLGADAAPEGAVRVSVIELFAEWLAEEFAAFSRSYPKIRIELIVDNASANLVRREADIAVRMFRPDQPDLVARKVGEHGLGFFASPEYLEKHGTPQRFRDLREHDIVGFDEAAIVSGTAKAMERLAPRERYVFRSNGLMVHVAAMKAGLGVGGTSAFLAEREGGLVRVLEDKANIMQEIWLVTHEDLRRSARIRATMDFLAAVFENNGPALAGESGARCGPPCE